MNRFYLSPETREKVEEYAERASLSIDEVVSRARDNPLIMGWLGSLRCQSVCASELAVIQVEVEAPLHKKGVVFATL